MNYDEYTNLTEGEQSLVDWQYGRCGHFFTCLWQAICRADDGNQERLRLAFPSHVDAYRKYAYEDGWWQKIQERLELGA